MADLVWQVGGALTEEDMLDLVKNVYISGFEADFFPSRLR